MESSALGNIDNVLSEEHVVTVLLLYSQTSTTEMVQGVLADQANIVLHCSHISMDVKRAAEYSHATVILQEIGSSGTNELALVQQYRAFRTMQNIPIIILSSSPDVALKREAFKLGVNDYLIGTPDPIELLTLIRHHSRSYWTQVQYERVCSTLHEAHQRLAEMNVELQRLSNADGLTDLSSRRLADNYLSAEWKRATREQRPLSILVIDLDDFKRYNDVYGYLAGDKILKRIAALFKQTLQRPSDLAARFSGARLFAVLPNTGLTGVQFVAENIRNKVERLHIPHRASTVTDHLTVSIGVASVIPQRGDSFEALVEAANAALHEAKQTGKNRVSATPSGLEGSGAVNRLGDVLSAKQLKKIPKYLV